MKYLLYCIFRSPEYQMPETLLGVDGQKVVIVGRNGLRAAISPVAQPVLTPDLSRLLAYKKVVESFHCDRTIIPMRFGSLFDEESQIIRLLEKQAEQYTSLLNELEGCVEIGIKVIISDFGSGIADFGSRESSIPKSLNSSIPKSSIPNPWPRPGLHRFSYGRSDIDAQEKKKIIQSMSRQGGHQSSIPHPTSHIPHRKSPTSGRAYLAARKEHYTQEDQLTEEMEKIAQHFRTAFSGLFTKCKTEFPQSTIINRQSSIPNPTSHIADRTSHIADRTSHIVDRTSQIADRTSHIPNHQSSINNHQSKIQNPKSKILSLHFLVPRRSVESFRRTFQEISRKEGMKMLLSGPWPPYNFVVPEPSTDRKRLLSSKTMVGKE